MPAGWLFYIVMAVWTCNGVAGMHGRRRIPCVMGSAASVVGWLLTEGLFFLFCLFHVVEHVLHVLVLLQLFKQLFDGCALVGSDVLKFVGNAFKF